MHEEILKRFCLAEVDAQTLAPDVLGSVIHLDRVDSNVQIEDMRRGVHEHLTFGEGEIAFAPVLAALREMDYRGGVHVELSRHSHDAVETARKALAFLTAQGA